MRTLLTLLLLAASTLVPAFAQEGTPIATKVAIPAEKAELVDKILALPAINNMFDKATMNEALQAAVTRSAAAAGIQAPTLPAGALITDEDIRIITTFARTAYGNNFTVPELQAMYNFYNSPEGASVAAKMPQLMAEMGPVLGQLQAVKIQNLLKSGAIRK